VDSLESPNVCVRQATLRLLGNMASERVDEKARSTKRLLQGFGAFEKMVPFIWSEKHTTLCYALGAVQNMCTFPEFADYLCAGKAAEQLVTLSKHEDKDCANFANGALYNMKALLRFREGFTDESTSKASGGSDSQNAGDSAPPTYGALAASMEMYEWTSLMPRV